jgi:two-component system chemotaxis response regulator CheB
MTIDYHTMKDDKISKVVISDCSSAVEHSEFKTQTEIQKTGAFKTGKVVPATRINKAKKLPTPSSQCIPARHVIAMAASVGGLKALSVILGDLPADFPAAIVIVMHVSPDHESMLAEILNWRTHLVVKQAKTGDKLCDSSVFVAPPNHHLFVLKSGSLDLSSATSEKVHHARPSAEPLFASVADIYKKNAIAVVLTGGDGDGSIGVQIIKEKGGMVIAQDRPTSQDFSMPETSIKTGDVDFILPLKEIAPKLIELVAQATNNGMPKQPLPGN